MSRLEKLAQFWRREANKFRTIAQEMFDAGDGGYPGLDKDSKSFYSRLRQGSSCALIGVVSIFVIAGVFFWEVRKAYAGPSPLHVVSEAKLSESGFREPVTVANLSPYIEPSSAGAHISRVDSFSALSHFNPWGDNIGSANKWINAFGRFEKLAVVKYSVDTPFDLSGGQFPYILESDIAGKERVSASKWGDSERVYADIGALKDTGIVRLDVNPPPGREPQSEGGDKKKEGEKSKNGGVEGDRIVRGPVPPSAQWGLVWLAALGASVGVILMVAFGVI